MARPELDVDVNKMNACTLVYIAHYIKLVFQFAQEIPIETHTNGTNLVVITKIHFHHYAMESASLAATPDVQLLLLHVQLTIDSMELNNYNKYTCI